MTLRASGPEYSSLRTFRDDDLLDPGSDPLISLLAALSELNRGERIVTRLMLNSLGPDWSQGYMEKAHGRPAYDPVAKPDANQAGGLMQMDGMTMAVLGVAALAAVQGYMWVRGGEAWKAALLGVGAALGLGIGGWIWQRWKSGRNRIYDPLLIREKGGPHGVRRRDTGGGHASWSGHAGAGGDPPWLRGLRLPPLQPSGGGQVHGGKDQASGPQPGSTASLGPRPIRKPQRHGREGGGGPVASPGGH